MYIDKKKEKNRFYGLSGNSLDNFLMRIKRLDVRKIKLMVFAGIPKIYFSTHFF